MSALGETAWDDPPAGAEEVLLAEFIESALECMARGETVDVRKLLVGAPELMERGQRLLADAAQVLGAADALRDHSRWLRSDLVAQSNDRRAPEVEADITAAPDPFPGEFRISRWLGAGNFGTVWLAEDLHLGRLVALKTVRLPASSPSSVRLLARLREEARLLASVRHRNVTQVHAWRETGAPTPGAGAGDHYLILEYVPGGSLEDRVGNEGPLPWRLAARYLADVAEGLLEVHAQGIVHRDVKPANILWNPDDDEAVLTDFGVSARLADAGSVAGTPFYMPPEAFEGTVGPAQDVYGLAASLFWLVTGSVPFPGPGIEEIIAQARQGLPVPEARCASLPEPLERLIRAGLAADSRRRPGLGDFIKALRGGLNRLLADSLLLAPGRPRQAPVQLHLTISRRNDRHTYLPVVTTQPPVERFVRDIRQVPRQPEGVDVRTGDRLRIEVETDRTGFVTVFNVGPTGNLNLLFPAGPARSAQPAPVTGGQPVHILDVELAPPAGRERLFALWTRAPLPLRLDELASLAERGAVPGSGPYRATRDMVRVQESVQRLGPEDWHTTLLELNHLNAVENVP